MLVKLCGLGHRIAMVILEHVATGYLPGKDILKDISFSLERGSFHFLSGPSGSGKTTLLGLMSLAQRLPREALPELRRKIGLVSQDYRLLPHQTVMENVALPLKVAGEMTHHIARKVDEMLDWVGLRAYRDERPDVLSGGQKQRVAIARAVVTKPDILLCDEPSGNLDIQLSLRFMYLFEALNKMGTTVFFATHDDFLIAQHKYPVLRLHDGELVDEKAHPVKPHHQQLPVMA
jgi:cell division transport system ATP-binding protein